MLSCPCPTEAKLYSPALCLPNTVDSISYHDGFTFDALSPRIGELFQIYVPHVFISLEHPPIKNSIVFGSTYYAPSSDISAVVFHSGCLFIHPKLKSFNPQRFSTVQNLYEVMASPEAEYSKVAVVLDLPTDLQIQGVLVRLYVDQSPLSFPATVHNGYKSQELPHVEQYSLRIVNFNIITMYDDPPNIVPVDAYRRQTAAVPKYLITFTGELGIEYNQNIFAQIFSRFNVVRDTFRFFRFYFDCGNNRYEIVQIEGTRFKIIRSIEQLTVEVIRTPNTSNATAVDVADMTEFGAMKKAIIVKDVKFGPITALLLIPKKHYT